MIDEKIEYMDNYYDDNESLFNSSQGGRYIRFQEKISDKEKRITKVINQFELILYNNEECH